MNRVHVGSFVASGFALRKAHPDLLVDRKQDAQNQHDFPERDRLNRSIELLFVKNGMKKPYEKDRR